MDPQAYQEFVKSMERLREFKYISVSLLAYIIVDYLDTFQAEVKYIWNENGWNLVKVLFFLSRYMVFIDVPGKIIVNEWLDLSSEACMGFFAASTFLCVLATAFAEAIMFLRVYALSKQNRAFKIYLWIHWTLIQLANIALFAPYIRSVTFRPAPPGVTNWHCYYSATQITHLAAIFGIVLANQAIITGLGFYFVYANFREAKGALIDSLIRDGILYFALITALTIINFVATIVLPEEHKFMFATAQRVFHSTLATRIVLNMRQAVQASLDGGQTDASMSGMRFTDSSGTKMGTLTELSMRTRPSSGARSSYRRSALSIRRSFGGMTGSRSTGATLSPSTDRGHGPPPV